MNKATNNTSTFEKAMLKPVLKKKFNKEYKSLVISEIVLALMQGNCISVRKLAREAGISPSIVQGIRSGSHNNITLKNFLNLISALGSEVKVKVGRAYMPLKAA